MPGKPTPHAKKKKLKQNGGNGTRNRPIPVARLSKSGLTTHKEASVPKLAHEFRTRLSIIHGALDNVIDEIFGPLNIEQKKHLSLAVESVDRMVDLVEDLMVSFSDSTGTMRLNLMNVPIQELIQRAVDSMQSEAFKEGVTLKCDADDKKFSVECDPAKIEQVVINLLRNAVKFTSRGGSVIVRMADQGAKVAVSVADTGVGIPRHKLERIFSAADDIGALKDSNGGFRTSGLGLIIVKEIIEAHKGKIKVSSEIGKGTTFVFTLNKE